MVLSVSTTASNDNNKQRVLIIKNMLREGPGIFRDVLHDHGVKADVVELERGELLPDVTAYGAVIVMGGAQSANDNTPTMRALLVTVRNVLDNNIPYLGVCLGHQVLCKAAGGTVRKMSTPEAGFVDTQGAPFTIRPTSSGQDDQLFQGFPESFPTFQLHGEEVVPHADTTVIATNGNFAAQAIRVGTYAYGVQFHAEMVPEMLSVWRAQDEMLHTVSLEDLQSQFAQIADTYMQHGKLLCANFLVAAGLLSTVDIDYADVREDMHAREHAR